MPVRTLAPLIVVPCDGAGWDGRYIAALDAAVDVALDWWEQQLGIRPFTRKPVFAMGGLHPRAYYSAQPNTQELLRAELSQYFPELEGREDDATVYLVYATLGADPYTCQGNVIGTSPVWERDHWSAPILVVQSSGSLDAYVTGQNPLDPLSGSRDAQTGALAHELGHALSLLHPTSPGDQAASIMWSWWLFPTIGLTDYERGQARSYATNWSRQLETAP